MKNNGKWLWLAIAVGKGTEVYTHANQRKRVAFRLLPCKSAALDGKPRGLREIQDSLVAHVRAGSMLVYDGWTSTDAAALNLKYQRAPPVCHEDAYRDSATGFHTNDAESENNRVKRWSRRRYGQVNLTEHEMQEYVFYENVGPEADDMFRGLAMSSGGVISNAVV